MQSVVFLHLPKAAGMSFGQIVLRQFPRRALLNANAADLATFAAQWSALAEDRRARVRCIHGHVPFGVHAVLPEPVRYLTMLRDPVDRVVSAYYYALRRPEVATHRELVRSGASLHAYVTGELSADVHEAQTRALAGGPPAAAPLERTALEHALRNLVERFALAGLCERFDETVLVCRRVLGWSNVHYVERNRNRRRARLTDVPAPTIAAIHERNPLDAELYAMAAERFAELLRVHPIPAAELHSFRGRNRVYGLARRLLDLPLAVVRDVRVAAARARRA